MLAAHIRTYETLHSYQARNIPELKCVLLLHGNPFLFYPILSFPSVQTLVFPGINTIVFPSENLWFFSDLGPGWSGFGSESTVTGRVCG